MHCPTNLISYIIFVICGVLVSFTKAQLCTFEVEIYIRDLEFDYNVCDFDFHRYDDVCELILIFRDGNHDNHVRSVFPGSNHPIDRGNPWRGSFSFDGDMNLSPIAYLLVMDDDGDPNPDDLFHTYKFDWSMDCERGKLEHDIFEINDYYFCSNRSCPDLSTTSTARFSDTTRYRNNIANTTKAGLPSTNHLVQARIDSNTTWRESTTTEANANTNTTQREGATTEVNAKTRHTGCIPQPYLIGMVVLSVVMIPVAIYLLVRVYQMYRIIKTSTGEGIESEPNGENGALFGTPNSNDNSETALQRSGSALEPASMDSSTMISDTQSRTVTDSFDQAMTMQANVLSQQKYLRVTQTKRKSGMSSK